MNVRCIRLLYIMARWELMRTLYERGLVQRLVLPHIIFLIWIVANGVFLPWILQTHQVMLGLILVSSGMLILPRVADSFAGERERATLEVLLLSPVPDWILVAGKTMALLAIATLSFVTALCVYGIATVLFISSALPVIWYAMALLIGLTALLTLINLGLIVSLQAPSVQTAQQILIYPPVLVISLSGILAPRLFPPHLILSALSVVGWRDLAIISITGAISSFLIVFYAFHRGRLFLR